MKQTTGLTRSRWGAAMMAALLGLLAARGMADDRIDAADQPTPRYSALWGVDGERYDPTGRLPDFSFAGYRQGEAPLPDTTGPAVTSVRDHGAVGDGETDDTQAFRRAIAATERGIIDVPPGRYILTDLIQIEKPGVILRGAGPDRTTLHFPKPLHAIHPRNASTTGGQATSAYSWSGGFLIIQGDFRTRTLTTIRHPAKRGTSMFEVDDASRLQPGQFVELAAMERRASETDDRNALARHLYANDPGDLSNRNGHTLTRYVVRIESVEGSCVTIDRPLRWDVQSQWRAEVRSFEPTVTESGIVDLSISFPVTPYKGHFTEQGFNAIVLNGVAHCFVRNVVIANCDSGLFISGRFCTLQDITFTSDRPTDRGKHHGHHGITFGTAACENLFTRFDFRMRFIHDITMTACANGNVVASGRGMDLCFDHHRRAPHGNLFTDLDLGVGSRMYASGGGQGLGRHSGALTTFWGIRSQRPVPAPPRHFAPDLITLVAVHTRAEPRQDIDGIWIEPLADIPHEPINLYEAMLRRRLGQP